jgi:hypothetical protein
VIPEAGDERMPVVQVEVHVLAEPPNRACDLEHMRQGAPDRVPDVVREAGQAVVRRAELLQVQAGMAAAERGGHLPQAHVADIDAAADPLSVLEPLRHLDEPSAIQPGRVLEEDEGTVRPLAKARVQVAQAGQQAIRMRLHLALVVDDQAGDTACEAVGEFAHQGAVPPVQHVHVAVQVHHGQARMGGHELQDILEVVRRAGVYLGGHPHLGEAEPREPEQRIVPVDALLEQGVHWFATIHDPQAARGSRSAARGKPSTVRGMARLSRFSWARALSWRMQT